MPLELLLSACASAHRTCFEMTEQHRPYQLQSGTAIAAPGSNCDGCARLKAFSLVEWDEYSVRQPFVCNLRLECLQQDVVTRRYDIASPVHLEDLIDFSFGLLGHLRSNMFDAT
jgi:hypothetical protein